MTTPAIDLVRCVKAPGVCLMMPYRCVQLWKRAQIMQHPKHLDWGTGGHVNTTYRKECVECDEGKNRAKIFDSAPDPLIKKKAKTLKTDFFTIKAFAVQEGWESEAQMLSHLARVHGYAFEIANALGICRASVTNRCRANGITLKKFPSIPPTFKPRSTPS